MFIIGSNLEREVIPIAKQKNTKLNYQNLVINTVKEKYAYLLVGLTVLLVVYLVLTGFLAKTKFFQAKKEVITNKQEVKTSESKKYLVKDGDDLWSIAEANYGSGYNFTDLAQANNINDPDVITSGQTLVIPSLTPKEATKGEIAPAQTEQVTITGAQYTVKAGDYLWQIALDSYGDGYAWTKIAQANNLADPNIIHEGNVLIIPR